MLALLGAVHLTQGTSDIGVGDLLGVLIGGAEERTRDVLAGSRVPRTLAALVAGAAIGTSGALFQAVARNPLAAPDTLGVNAGGYFAVVATTALGIPLTGVPRGGVAFAGGVAASTLVYLIAAGVRVTPVRLVLAGISVALAFSSGAAALLLLFEQQTSGLYLWGQGSLVQAGSGEALRMVPFLAVGFAGALLARRPLDVLATGDETARALGVRVGRLRLGTVTLAVVLAAVAVAVTGPIGFLGVIAPQIVRLLGVRGHALLLPGAALWGALLLIGSDVITRAITGAETGTELPAGVVMALAGAPLFLWLARRAGAGEAGITHQAARPPRAGRGLSYTLALVGASAVLACALVGSLVFGDGVVPLRDLLALARGEDPGFAGFLIGEIRAPRALVALVAGAALAASGAILQGVVRNPLADPTLLGVAGGAGVCGLGVLLVLPDAPAGLVPAGAAVGGALAFATIYAISWRGGGIAPTRFVLVGLGMFALTQAIVAFLVVGAELQVAQALTWISGSTYARDWSDLALLAGVPLVLLPAAWIGGRQLDLLVLGEDAPRALGLGLERARLLLLALAVLLAASAVAGVGTIGFVGLVAPHAARVLVGGTHRRMLPVTCLLGGALVVVADTVGRTVIAPAEIPSGLLTALLGAPYFLWLLRRTRARAA